MHSLNEEMMSQCSSSGLGTSAAVGTCLDSCRNYVTYILFIRVQHFAVWGGSDGNTERKTQIHALLYFFRLAADR